MQIRDSVLQMIETRRLNRRRRLPYNQLKRIPTQTWDSELSQDMCTICLENYGELDRVRILPCSHGMVLLSIYQTGFLIFLLYLQYSTWLVLTPGY